MAAPTNKLLADAANQIERLADNDDDNVVEEAAWFAYDRSWDNIKEDEKGNIVISKREQQQRRKKRLTQLHEDAGRNVQRGLLRYVYIIVDHSRSSEATDFKPSREVFVERILEIFIQKFFLDNPLSKLGLIIAHNGVADRISALGATPQLQIEALRAPRLYPDKGGDFSLQNVLLAAKRSLTSIPIHGSREVLLLQSSTSTVDAGNVSETIADLKKSKIKVSVVALGCELYVCKKLAKATGGTYHVPQNEEKFRDIVMAHIPPKPLTKRDKVKREWIQMGFPQKKTTDYPTLCQCHKKFVTTGYQCPRCKSLICDLPSTCAVCKLTLVSAPHLARSYHHLFPLNEYEEIPEDELTEITPCHGCFVEIDPKTSILTRHNGNVFCAECDLFAHETLCSDLTF